MKNLIYCYIAVLFLLSCTGNSISGKENEQILRVGKLSVALVDDPVWDYSVNEMDYAQSINIESNRNESAVGFILSDNSIALSSLPDEFFLEILKKLDESIQIADSKRTFINGGPEFSFVSEDGLKGVIHVLSQDKGETLIKYMIVDPDSENDKEALEYMFNRAVVKENINKDRTLQAGDMSFKVNDIDTWTYQQVKESNYIAVSIMSNNGGHQALNVFSVLSDEMPEASAEEVIQELRSIGREADEKVEDNTFSPGGIKLRVKVKLDKMHYNDFYFFRKGHRLYKLSVIFSEEGGVRDKEVENMLKSIVFGNDTSEKEMIYRQERTGYNKTIDKAIPGKWILSSKFVITGAKILESGEYEYDTDYTYKEYKMGIEEDKKELLKYKIFEDKVIGLYIKKNNTITCFTADEKNNTIFYWIEDVWLKWQESDDSPVITYRYFYREDFDELVVMRNAVENNKEIIIEALFERID